MTFHEQITNDALALYDKGNLPREKLEFIQRELLATDARYNSLFTRYQELEQREQQLTKAKEIIKDLLTLPFANNWEVYADVTSHLDRAEQFLKEVTK